VVSNSSAVFALFERVCGSQARAPSIHTACERLLSAPVEITFDTVSASASITLILPLRKCVTYKRRALMSRASPRGSLSVEITASSVSDSASTVRITAAPVSLTKSRVPSRTTPYNSTPTCAVRTVNAVRSTTERRPSRRAM
jgi:hypothetical protein